MQELVQKFINDHCYSRPGELITFRDFQAKLKASVKEPHLINRSRLSKALRALGVAVGQRGSQTFVANLSFSKSPRRRHRYVSVAAPVPQYLLYRIDAKRKPTK